MSKDSPYLKKEVTSDMDFQLDPNVAREFENNAFHADEAKFTSPDLEPVKSDFETGTPRLTAAGELQIDEQRSLVEQVWERRKSPRASQEEKGIRGRFRREINYLVDLIESSWRGWFALFAILFLSVALMFWSLTVRRDLIKQHDTLSKEYFMQQSILDDLLQRWSQGELRTLKERVHSAESRVFPDYQKLAGWLNQQSLIAAQLNLTMQYNLSKTLPTQIKNVGEVPIVIKVSAKPEHTRHSYLRVLEFIHGLINDQWHLEIANTLVQSSGLGISHMDMRIHIWVHDRNIEIVQQ